jgi:iron complex outermembrane receptor protein
MPGSADAAEYEPDGGRRCPSFPHRFMLRPFELSMPIVRRARWALCLGIAVFAGASGVGAQSPADSLREYDLGEVVVGSGVEERLAPSTVQRIPLAAVDRLDAATLDAAVRLIPAAHVQTNSRGETLVYLRAAGERQVALFFDGALLNIPWDNRIDLGLLPSGVVGGITVAKGVPSVLWGANVLGGVVNVVSRGLDGDGTFTEATVQGGSNAFGRGVLTHLGKRGRLSYVGSAGYARRDGFAVPADLDDAGLRFSQTSDAVRTNTDARLANGFGRVAYAFGSRTRVGLAALHVDGEKGVAPEGHLDPDTDRVRFWRYPDSQLAMLILNGEAGLGEATTLRGALWGSRFGQTIADYASAGYDRLRSEQDDEDLTLGGRAILQRPFRLATLRLSVNALTSTHRQREVEFDDGGQRMSPELTFRQGLYSAGLEAEASPLDPLTLTAGVSVDALTAPETGDKPPRDPFVDYGATAGGIYRFGDAWALNASVGRKTRFPTLRELFGEALNRFLVNPDLGPETSLLAEVGVQRSGERVSGEATLFLNRTDDTIDQRRLDDGRRQRVNLGGSRVYGVELAGAARPGPVRLDGHLTLMHVRGTDGEGGTTRLSEKPEAIGRLAAAYNPGLGPNGTVEAVYSGVAFSPVAGGFARLAPSLVLNVRAGYRLLVRDASAEVFVRVGNLTDAVVLPQLGLPAPGRELQAGVKLAL